MRSFLGSFKQLSPTLPNYAVVIHQLDQLVGGKKSAEKIQWSEELEKSFKAAKDLAANPTGIVEPRPEDILHTFSDYSAQNNAVGGRLIIIRQSEKGVEELVGGFFSAVLDKRKHGWLACEGEAVGIRLVLDHFRHHIRESTNTTIHYTDSKLVSLLGKGAKGEPSPLALGSHPS